MASGLWLAVTGHSPYRQWQVYRKVRLVVVVSAEDTVSVQLGQAIAESLGKHLPESRAMMSRARDINDLVRLIASRQLDTALMREEDATAAFRGAGRFADNGTIPLRALAQFGSHLFVCRDDFPQPNAYQLAETLAEQWQDVRLALPSRTRGPKPISSGPIPLHPGALEYYADHPPRD